MQMMESNQNLHMPCSRKTRKVIFFLITNRKKAFMQLCQQRHKAFNSIKGHKNRRRAEPITSLFNPTLYIIANVDYNNSKEPLIQHNKGTIIQSPLISSSFSDILLKTLLKRHRIRKQFNKEVIEMSLLIKAFTISLPSGVVGPSTPEFDGGRDDD